MKWIATIRPRANFTHENLPNTKCREPGRDHGGDLTRRRGERGDFGKDQSSPVKTSSSASSAPPRESSDVARYKDSDQTDGFNPVEFDGIRMQAGFNGFFAAAYARPSCRKGRRGK